MSQENDYLDINRKTWNEKVNVHVNSDFYKQQDFLDGKNTLQQIEFELLGNVKDKRILHLQCHFGQDTISLARMGATTVGVDFSDKAIDVAEKLAKDLDADASFICSDIYDLPNRMYQEFDIVFTSYGTIGWLPDLDKWAKVISHFLKPGGKFVFAEFHPVIWMYDDDFSKITYNYFKSDPILEESTGTYAEKESDIVNKTISWNHSLSEVFTSLISNGLTIQKFNEYDYSPYDCFNQTEEFEPGKFRIKHLGNHIPMVYSITAFKK
ncbi:class I SAM-dependent methyltransferase [Flavobacterium sp. MAH-1]|uniref:Class I SAM-dependent methyltransferase n=1 Tax=Flavobacterium agri TaxID=2743471 RepID=A0A7Y8XZV6_9FLAO|nr:class I SAM-dependent methyltransferase [Flavobacterium agri]NUY79825.1 class I SAM-dependent methyltransferase [Flavobacterium agri]NYA69850.1 class I SAM-dependent methyltransferase [Flavobacterium agri]